MLLEFSGKTYTLDTEEITISQAMFIKSKTGLGLKSWQDAVGDADPDAVKALYWLMCDQSGERCVWERIDFLIVKFFSAFADALAEGDDDGGAPTPTRP